MNGRPLPEREPEMQALVAYIKFLSTGVPRGEVLPGMGVGRMPELDRQADPQRGQMIYTNVCAGCHGADGKAFAAACRAPIWATLCRPFGAVTASMTEPAWRV